MPVLALTEAEEALGHLEHLTDVLRSRGWTVEVSAHADRWPSALVANPAMPAMNESVIAVQEAHDRTWSYRYGWGERIAPCTDAEAAAAALVRVLAVKRDA
ncbi:hypothetical protein BJF79_09975 [Actinomadura sp. CNU-125]|uniref:hypothetical protein n=1 Tax=Actinomadura sp. CNU-125 TaxID=1904961 RepID=UPI00095A245D|nr:hypothetical protein [Actinomadura sp. CNU-125]OLT30218.1 hypothetical protein BJF79_09975 [Actinomadura sp. CNU-125]